MIIIATAFACKSVSDGDLIDCPPFESPSDGAEDSDSSVENNEQSSDGNNQNYNWFDMEL